MTSSRGLLDTADVVVIGAGIVGLAHAYRAVERGLSVVVIERDQWATGASVRNFGHGCLTAQHGTALDFGSASRADWLALAKTAGFWLREGGTVVAARAEDEYAVLTEFADLRGDQVRLLSAAEVADRASLGPEVIGGAEFPMDFRVDPREAVHAIARHLAAAGVRFHWATTAHLIEPGEVTTSRGLVRGDSVIVTVGHDVDRHFPELAQRHAIQRCELHMLRVADPHHRTVDPAVLTGFALLRYEGFASCRSLPAVRSRLDSEHAELTRIGLNLMFTQLPDGDLTIGDTHHYATTVDPYRGEDLDDRVLAASASLLGVAELTVRERWRGVYAAAPDPFLVAEPADGVRVVSVTSGIGMTTAFGLATSVIDTLT